MADLICVFDGFCSEKQHHLGSNNGEHFNAENGGCCVAI